MLPVQTCAVTLSAGPMPSEGVGGITLTDRAFICSEWPPSAEKAGPDQLLQKKERVGHCVAPLTGSKIFRKVGAEKSFMSFLFLINCTWNWFHMQCTEDDWKWVVFIQCTLQVEVALGTAFLETVANRGRKESDRVWAIHTRLTTVVFELSC